MMMMMRQVTLLLLLLSAAAGAVAFSTTNPQTSSSTTTATSSASSTETTANENPWILDEEAWWAQSEFPLSPTQLIARAKQVLSPEIRLGQKDNGACLAEDFEFCAAVVGPISKSDYLNALGSFQLTQAFDVEPNFFGWTVDPMQPNRVWFFNRLTGKHTGEFMGAAPTGKTIAYPTQTHHLDFDPEGRIREYGFYTVDRRQGNTGGLGGAFGFMYAVGKPLPIPECQPYQPSWQFRMLNWVGGLARRMRRNRKSE